VVLTKASRVDLADSALPAPAAGFGEEDVYSDLVDKAAWVPGRGELDARVAGVTGRSLTSNRLRLLRVVAPLRYLAAVIQRTRGG